VQVIHNDADLARLHAPGLLLVAEHGSRLAAQHTFLRGPLILIDAHGDADTFSRSRAYAVVRTVAAAMLAIDRFFEHRRLASASRRARRHLVAVHGVRAFMMR
jgi:hypothetical protein